MNLRALYNSRLLRYLIVGGCAAVIDISTFTFLAIYFQVNILVSSIISFIFAVTANYYLGIAIAFKSEIRFNRIEEFILVFLVSFSGLLINIASLYLILNFTSLGLFIAKASSAIPTFVWNFMLRRNYIFKVNVK